jgi:hypothetical protein
MSEDKQWYENELGPTALGVLDHPAVNSKRRSDRPLRRRRDGPDGQTHFAVPIAGVGEFLAEPATGEDVVAVVKHLLTKPSACLAPDLAGGATPHCCWPALPPGTSKGLNCSVAERRAVAALLRQVRTGIKQVT